MNVYLFVSCVVSIGLTVYISVDKPYSLLYQHFHTKETLQTKVGSSNEERVKLAKEYFRKKGRHIFSLSQGAFVDLLVVIVTVARENKAKKGHYLTQTAAAMDSALHARKLFKQSLLLICNADKFPNKHLEAIELRNFSSYVDKLSTHNYPGPPPAQPIPVNSGLHDNARKQEISDYVFCLNASLQYKYKHVLFLEDDVLPLSDTLQTLSFVLLNKLYLNQNMYTKSSQSKRNYSFLKLYYPRRWQGYAYESDRLLELLAIGLVGGGIGLTLLLFSRSSYLNRSVRRMYLFFIFFFSIAICVAKLLGRVNVIEIRRLSPQLYKFGLSSACCTQAMVYPREIVPDLMAHLLVNNSVNKDLAIYKFSEIRNTPGYQIEPNLFLHTGMYTSLSGGADKHPEEFDYVVHKNIFEVNNLDTIGNN